jgi:sterol 3beta-glucosyltransferase
MRDIAIVASGTRGDVQPYVALGKGLKAAGYRVRLLGSANFEQLATGAGLAFAAMGPNIEAMLQGDEWRQTLESSNFLLILSQMQKEMKQQAAIVAERIPALLQGSDFIVTGAGGLGGTFAVAHHLNIPIVRPMSSRLPPRRNFPAHWCLIYPLAAD